MISCILVDDDRWALIDMRHSFPFEQFDIQVTDTFSDALSALEHLRKRKTQIVIADIRMQNITGIDLLNMCREEGIQSQFIFVSGYDSFDYAQSALNSGAVYYLIKPVNAQEAEKAFIRVTKLLNPEKEIHVSPDSLSAFDAAVDYLNKHFTEPFELNELSAKLYVSVSYLSDMFTKRKGMTFSQYRNRLRIDYAKKLLAAGLSVEEAASRSGYDNPKYFSKVFRSIEGLLPSEYKKQNR